MERVRQHYFPTTSLMLLMCVGVIDMVMTAVLHSRGMIVELNPLMRPLIDSSEWLFAAVKGATLLVAYLAMIEYARQNMEFVKVASRIGVLLYVGIWLIGFTAAA
jgi:hypothetical protein